MKLSTHLFSPHFISSHFVFNLVATADEAAQEVERVLGMWTHVCRVTSAGKEQDAHTIAITSISTALYQQDKLLF